MECDGQYCQLDSVECHLGVDKPLGLQCEGFSMLDQLLAMLWGILLIRLIPSLDFGPRLPRVKLSITSFQLRDYGCHVTRHFKLLQP